ncbi:hypothetical protein KM620_gp049 [Hyposidra talaca nucleopolyhedrovirus]|uniref:Uncharacterized protein n=1 Tax=Hyposidra talaca nucleopolyhedrovirus TaxID=1070315 RepID=A0A2Z4HHZ9_9ABAC|nr:hypothetical protein KM620_gp049 [Hyposidra talaca nucleopolyhedrovirus]AWW14409.1 hypothetical protein HytaNPV_gp049 [Hyposidra talaca nucleopolyhedrovirus]
MSDTTVVGTRKKRRSGVGLFKKKSTTREIESSTTGDYETMHTPTKSTTPLPEYDFDTGYEDINVLMEESENESPNIPITIMPESTSTPKYTEPTTSGSVKRKHENDNDFSNRFRNIRAASDSNVVDLNVEYVFINGPILNQSFHERVDLLQDNIDRLFRWVSTFNQIDSIKTCFIFTNKHIDSKKLNLKYNLDDLYLYKINKVHLLHFVDMTYSFYTKLINNLFPIANIAINVNYTAGFSDLTQLCTYFINYCVFEFYRPFFYYFHSVSGGNLLNDADQQYFESYINEKQTDLTAYYNSKLINLEAHKYYKYTPDNDINTNKEYNSQTVLQKNLPFELDLYKVNVYIVSMCKKLRF